MYKTPEMFRENLDVCYQKESFIKIIITKYKITD